jgi:hypothetical protein
MVTPGWTAGADDWRSCCARRAVANLAFGVRHTNRFTKHGFHSEALRYETTGQAETASATG